MSDPRKTLQILFRRVQSWSPSEQAEDWKKDPGSWPDVEYGYVIVSGSRNSCATELSLFG
jgi:hypothetical protein